MERFDMNVPVVSVIIPTYNRAQMVCDCVASVLATNYPELEVVVVDDCSPDDTGGQIMKRFGNDEFDIVLFFGPMYHLNDEAARESAMLEAKRVLKPGGHLFISYIMNEYSVLMYGFKEHHMKEAIANGMIDEEFKCTEKANPLYHYVRLEDIYQQMKSFFLI